MICWRCLEPCEENDFYCSSCGKLVAPISLEVDVTKLVVFQSEIFTLPFMVQNNEDMPLFDLRISVATSWCKGPHIGRVGTVYPKKRINQFVECAKPPDAGNPTLNYEVNFEVAGQWHVFKAQAMMAVVDREQIGSSKSIQTVINITESYGVLLERFQNVTELPAEKRAELMVEAMRRLNGESSWKRLALRYKPPLTQEALRVEPVVSPAKIALQPYAKYTVTAGSRCGPIIANGRCLLKDSRGVLHVLKSRSLEFDGSFEIDTTGEHPWRPRQLGWRLLCIDHEGCVTVIDSRAKHLLGRHRLPDCSCRFIEVHEGRLYCCGVDRVYIMDPDSGAILESFALDCRVDATFGLWAGGVIVFASDALHFVHAAGSQGSRGSQRIKVQGILTGEFVCAKNSLFFTSLSTVARKPVTHLNLLRAEMGGKVHSSLEFKGNYFPPVGVSRLGAVLLGGRSGTIRLLSEADGHTIFERDTRLEMHLAPAVIGDFVLIVSSKESGSEVVVLSLRNGFERVHVVKNCGRVTTVPCGDDSAIYWITDQKVLHSHEVVWS